ncbi:hypothetical protein BGZ80_007392, partial [Entomortierella chlamydospora]
MPFFKSNKNKSASVASTPAQTPRSSMQAIRNTQVNTMSHAQAIEMVMQKTASYPTPSAMR